MKNKVQALPGMEEFVSQPRKTRSDKGKRKPGHAIRVLKKVWKLLKTIL